MIPTKHSSKHWQQYPGFVQQWSNRAQRPGARCRAGRTGHGGCKESGAEWGRQRHERRALATGAAQGELP